MEMPEATGPGGGSEPGAPAAAEAPAGEALVDVAPPAPDSAAPEEPPPPSTAGTEASSAPGWDGPQW